MEQCGVVLTRRYIHYDWVKIMEALKELNNSIASWNPFQVDKAILHIKNLEQARLLYLNKGCVTINPYYVWFETWNIELHTSSRFISSYGDWLHFRGIPLHAWNLNTFTQIEEACNGYVAVGINTWRKLDLIEAPLKVKDNFVASSQLPLIK